MTRRRIPPLLLALCCGALIGGCGSGSSTKSTAATTTPAATTTTTSTPIPTGAANVQQAVQECKHLVQTQTKLTPGAKAKLEGVCEKAAKGDSAAVKQAAREVCEEVINSSSVPAGPAREQALAACKAK